MKLTKDNIKDLSVGDKIYLSNGRIITSYQYIGIIKNIGYYRLFSSIANGQISFLVDHEDSNDDLRNNLFTTYEEACLRFKVQLVNLIDHYNKHQLREFPIAINVEDQKYLYNYKKVK